MLEVHAALMQVESLRRRTDVGFRHPTSEIRNSDARQGDLDFRRSQHSQPLPTATPMFATMKADMGHSQPTVAGLRVPLT